MARGSWLRAGGRARRLLCALSLACLAAGCETGKKVKWRVLFACERAAQGVVLVRTRILRSGCEGAPVYEAELPRGGDGASAVGAPGKLPPGSYGFEATSVDSSGAIIAKACRVVFPEGRSQVEIVLSSARCSASDAGTMDSSDAASTGAFDAGVIEAGAGDPITDGACGCGVPDDDCHADAMPHCIDEDAGVSEPPEMRTIFFESFESPDVESSVQLPPSGWMAVGYPDYISIMDEAVGTFVTPYGQQALDIYTRPPPDGPSSLTTAASKLSAVLEAKMTYTLTFHVARHRGNPATGYVVELLAIDDRTGIETVLDSASGSAVETSDMTQSDRIVFATGPSHATLGQRMAIRLMKDPSVDWASNSLFDEIRLTMQSDAR